jgi:hypothetical protein
MFARILCCAQNSPPQARCLTARAFDFRKAQEAMAARRIKVAYDRPVDVLHVALGKYVAYEGDGLARGLEIDYSIEDDTAVGAKVIGFRRYGWDTEIDALSKRIGRLLKVDPDTLTGKISRAVEP